jgi:hypothetical protein
VVTYLLELEEDEFHQEELFILKPKTFGITYYNNKYPIAGLYSYDEKNNLTDSSNPLSYKDLQLIELVFIKDITLQK